MDAGGQFWWGSNFDVVWRKGPWTPQEDKLLIEHVNLHGEGRWNSVSRLTGLKRSGKSCRLRWVNYLRPDLKRGKITPHEETIILELQARWGNRWSTIARSLPGRTDNEIKNYWRTHFNKGKPTKNVERARARARFLRQQQQEQHNQDRRPQPPPPEAKQQQQEEEEEVQMADVMKGILMPQAEAAAMAQEMQEMSYMFPMYFMFQDSTDCSGTGGGSASEEGSAEEVPGSWGSLWNLEDAHAAGMRQDRAFSFE